MIKKNTICLLLSALLFTNCSDWLNVAPDNQVNEEQLFSTGDGYRNALNGVYLNLASGSLYGREMTWGFVDVIGQGYLNKKMDNITTYRKASEYKYDDASVKSVISGIWSTAYNDVANCNNLIRHVSVEDPKLFAYGEMERNMIWGEALALRAFIHFDMLRLFAPAMIKDDQKSYIPYLETYPATSTSYESNTAILTKIKNDLIKAKELLATCDLLPENKEWMETGVRMLAKGVESSVPEDVFLAYRGFRMNYYAVTATLARVYCWEGRYEDAFKQAKEVVDAKYDDDEDHRCFTFEEPTNLGSNMKDYNSIIMALSLETLPEDYLPYITSGNKTILLLDADAIYEGSKEDTRGTELLGTLDGNKYSMKNTIKKGEVGSDMIPVIRLSEMYYIMGEYYARNNQFKEASDALGVVRSARGIISKSVQVSSVDAYKDEMLKEVRKEFVCEGQLFFQYKRLDKKPVLNTEFVLSRPENEDI